MAETIAYGSWKSSLTAEKLADKGVRYGHMLIDKNDLYWLESRAKEKGRGVLVKFNPSTESQDVLPINVSVRTKVHEYGSGDFIVDNVVVYFSDANDQCVYKFENNNLIRLTDIGVGIEYRYADYELSVDRKHLVCVRETHDKLKVINELVAIELVNNSSKASVKVLQSGFDFYSYPRMSKQGNRLCWTCWNQPDMPWDASELWVADFNKDGTTSAEHKIAGGISASSNVLIESKLESEEKSSVSQPSWSEDGVLHYISDISGWTNIYSCRDGILNALTPIDREFGIPQWVFASSTYTITPDNQVYAVYIQQGQQQLCHIDADTGHIEPIPLPFKSFGEHLLFSNERLFFRAAGPAVSEAIYSYDINSESYSRISQLSVFPLSVEELSIAKTIEFESENGRNCHAFYYSPNNSGFTAPEKSLPPLIVMSHGGPTAMTDNSLDASIQFWTHRGFAVVDVNYGGSTGYGKKYRNQLLGNWGVVDVEDCIAAANYLVSEKLADPKSLLIRGGSAGGYTTLCALTFHNVFAAGMSRYGVADLESLASDSHKFEARYLDTVVGPYPEDKELYIQRSPIHSTEKLSCPILLLQGEDDKVVPPNQAEMMVKALEERKIPYAYQLYKGEGHGFRQASTIVNALNAELYFYRVILGLEDTENLPKIAVHNL